jgi:hypothetical protein
MTTPLRTFCKQQLNGSCRMPATGIAAEQLILDVEPSSAKANPTNQAC